MKVLYTAVLLLFLQVANTQTLTLEIPEHQFGLDSDISLALSRLDDIGSFSDLSSFSEIVISFNGDEYVFDNIPNSLSYTESYPISNGANQLNLYFTELPIIRIDSDNEIPDEPKVLAELSYADDSQVLTSFIGIELRGGFSQTLPKKTYDLEFWEDATGDDSQNVQFLDLRSDDDWILDAVYNEPLRMRAHISHKLWLEMHTLYYQSLEPEAKSGADVEFVEVFLNGNYNGLYNLSEQVDRKQLKLERPDGDILRGELYQHDEFGPSTSFSELIDFDNTSDLWGGYELKHPDEDDLIDWTNLHAFTDFVINSGDPEFVNNVWDIFLKENFVDYFLFLNLIRAQDNTEKNIYTAKFDTDEPYFYVAWDLDGVFGTAFDGSRRNRTQDILTNFFMDRVLELNPGDYQACASNRWIELRSNILSYESLSASFENLFNQLTDNKVYERESLVWDNYSFGQDDLNYTLTWLQERLCFLDSYFGFDQECQFTPLFDLSTVPMCATPNDTFTTTLAYDYQGKTPAWIDTIAVTADSDEGFEIISYSPTEIQSGRNEITVSVVYTGNCSESNVFICDVVGGGGAADCSQLVSSPIPCCCGDADTDSDGIFNDCDNCPTTANPDQADQNGNGIGDLCEGTSQFVSYPNPTDGNIRISAVNHNKSLNGLNPLYNLKLIDSNGQIVRNQNIENDEFEIETSDLQPGIYFLQIKDGNNNFVGREKIMILE